MDLSIVILHTGSPADVSKNLEALLEAKLPAKTEILVVNNGTPGSNSEIRVQKGKGFELRFYEIPNLGYTQGNNYGLSLVRGRMLCILNPDIVVGKRTFEVLLKYMGAHPEVGLVSPRLRYLSGEIQDNYRRFPKILDLFIKRTFLRHLFKRRMSRYLMWDKDTDVSEAVDWVTGAFQLFPRKLWEKIGPTDERFFLFMSDVDICRNTWEAGLQVHYVGETEALHHDVRYSAGGLFSFFKKRSVRLHVKDAYRYFKKYWRKPLPKRSPSGVGI